MEKKPKSLAETAEAILGKVRPFESDLDRRDAWESYDEDGIGAVLVIALCERESLRGKHGFSGTGRVGRRMPRDASLTRTQSSMVSDSMTVVKSRSASSLTTSTSSDLQEPSPRKKLQFSLELFVFLLLFGIQEITIFEEVFAKFSVPSFCWFSTAILPSSCR